MLKYLALFLFLVAGAGIGLRNLRAASRFEDFCSRMAATRSEEGELKSDRAKNDEGYGHYRRKVRNELVRPSATDFFPHKLQSEAAELGHYLALTTQLTVAFILALALFCHYASS